MNEEKIINGENGEIFAEAAEAEKYDAEIEAETVENTEDTEAAQECDGKTEAETEVNAEAETEVGAEAETEAEAEAMTPFAGETAEEEDISDEGGEHNEAEKAEIQAKPQEEISALPEDEADGEYTGELSENEIRAATSNPMFAIFARGKKQSFESVCADFLRMTRTVRDAGSKRMATPAGACAVSKGVALSDRQRTLAREYGMSYREYYDLINGIPSKLYK